MIILKNFTEENKKPDLFSGYKARIETAFLPVCIFSIGSTPDKSTL